MAEPRYIPVIAPDGSEMEVPEDRLDAAVQRGFKVDQSAQYKDQGLAAGLEGLARGATLGLSDVVQAEGAGIGTRIGNYLADVAGYGPQGVDRSDQADAAVTESKAAIQGRREANAGMATAGELTGALGLGLMTGGLGTAGLATRGTTTLGRAGYAALAGGLEGAAYGAAKAADDDFLADRDITAERILMGAGEGLVLGGGLAGAASLLGSGARYAADKAASALGSLGRRVGVLKPADETLDSLMTKASLNAEARAGVSSQDDLAAAANAESRVGLNTQDDLRASMSAESEAGVSFELAPAVDPVAQQEARGALIASGLKDDGRTIFQQARAAEGGFERSQQAATREISDDLKVFIRESDQIDEFAGIAAKRKASEQFNMPGMKIGMQEVGPVIDSARARINDLMSSEVRKEALKSGGGYTAVSRVQDMLNAVERDVSKAFARGDIGDGYMMLDQGLKKTMQQASKSRNPLVAEVFREESDRVLNFLQDDGIWGDLATRQKAANPAWTERIRRQNDADVGGFFKRSGDVAADPFEVLDKPNQATIGSLLSRLGDAESEGTEEAFRRYIRATAIDAETRAAAWGTPELRKRASTIKAMAEKIERRMDEVALQRRDASAWGELKKNVESVPFAGAVLKGAVSLTQRAAGYAESSASRSAFAEAGSASNATASSTRNAWADAGAASMAEVTAARKMAVIEGAKEAARRGENTLAASAAQMVRSLSSKAAKVADKIGSSIPIAGVVLRPSDPASYEGVIQHLQLLGDPSSDERRRLDDRLAELAVESPEHASALGAQIDRTAKFLLAKAGPSGIDLSQPFAHLTPPDHDRAKGMELARYARAAQNPQAALKRVASGSSTREDAETLQELYPRLWARFGTKVRAQLAGLKTAPSYNERLRLSEVLGQPMTPFDTQSFQQIIADASSVGGAAASAEAAPAVSPSNASTTKLSNANQYAAGSDQTLSRGQ